MVVLIKLGFLPRDKAVEALEESLCRDLWTLVKGEENHGVTFNTLRVVLLNMIGIKLRDRQYESNQEVSSMVGSAPDVTRLKDGIEGHG